MGRIESLNDPNRTYIFEEMVISTFEKQFRHFEEGEKLLRIARGDVAVISDIFCLFPVCLYSVCDKQAIRRFLDGERIRNKSLSIAGVGDEISIEQDFLGTRLDLLYKTGFLMKLNYYAAPYRPCTLYTVPKDTAELVTKKLDIRLVPEKWSSEAALYRVMGRASAANVASYLSLHKNYKGLEKGICNFNHSNITILPEYEYKDSRNIDYLVGIFYGYLRHDERIHTKAQFENSVILRVTFIHEYLTYRKKIKTCLVLSMENEEDFKLLCRAILASGLFDEEKLSRLYFTGEGIFIAAGEESRRELRGLFLRLKIDGAVEEDVTPEFLL